MPSAQGPPPPFALSLSLSLPARYCIDATASLSDDVTGSAQLSIPCRRKTSEPFWLLDHGTFKPPLSLNNPVPPSITTRPPKASLTTPGPILPGVPLRRRGEKGGILFLEESETERLTWTTADRGNQRSYRHTVKRQSNRRVSRAKGKALLSSVLYLPSLALCAEVNEDLMSLCLFVWCWIAWVGSRWGAAIEVLSISQSMSGAARVDNKDFSGHCNICRIHNGFCH